MGGGVLVRPEESTRTLHGLDRTLALTLNCQPKDREAVGSWVPDPWHAAPELSASLACADRSQPSPRELRTLPLLARPLSLGCLGGLCCQTGYCVGRERGPALEQVLDPRKCERQKGQEQGRAASSLPPPLHPGPTPSYLPRELNLSARGTRSAKTSQVEMREGSEMGDAVTPD